MRCSSHEKKLTSKTPLLAAPRLRKIADHYESRESSARCSLGPRRSGCQISSVPDIRESPSKTQRTGRQFMYGSVRTALIPVVWDASGSEGPSSLRLTGIMWHSGRPSNITALTCRCSHLRRLPDFNLILRGLRCTGEKEPTMSHRHIAQGRVSSGERREHQYQTE